MIIIYRMAAEADVGALALMRWDFRLEEAPGTPRHGQLSGLSAGRVPAVRPYVV